METAAMASRPAPQRAAAWRQTGGEAPRGAAGGGAGRLDLDDACSAAASCRSLHAAANVALSALDLSMSFTLSKKK